MQNKKIKVLIVKTSSMGDVIHTFPAVTDALKHNPNIEFHWLLEKSFAELAALHPGIAKVIPVEFRKWRKPWWKFLFKKEWRAFRSELKSTAYDIILDAQGLLKSAWLARQACGPVFGYDRHSIREPLAALFYQHRFAVSRQQHAIPRVRQLFAQVLGYSGKEAPIHYGLDRNRLPSLKTDTKNIVFLHGTTWANKQWPELYWKQLAGLLINVGFHIQLLWGNEDERIRAERLAEDNDGMTVMPKLNLLQAASVLANAVAIVAVDTGLAHLAAALDVPTVSVYGPTNPDLTGALGGSQIHLRSKFLCSPCLKRECLFKGPSNLWPACFEEITPERVFEALINRFSAS